MIYSYYMSQIGSLSSPFFYEDTSDPNASQELTFFVQPTITEKSVSRWNRWAIAPSYPALSHTDPNYWNVLMLTPQIPTLPVPYRADVEASFQIQPNVDAIVNPATQITYGTSAIGSQGMTTAPATLAGKTTAADTLLIPNSGLDYATVLSYSVKAQNQSAASLTAAHLLQ
jgi:hypothetical protein